MNFSSNNGEYFITKAIESVLKQSYSNYEIFISDDNSTDKSSEICINYSNADDRIRYVRQKTQLGEHRNKFYLINNAKGKYFKLLDQDDYLIDKTYLGSMVAKLNEGYDYGISNVDIKTIEASGNISVRKDTMNCYTNCITPFDFTISWVDESAMIFYGIYKRSIFKMYYKECVYFSRENYHNFIDFLQIN